MTKLNLKEWYEMKQTISRLTKKCEQHKKEAEKIMRDRNVNVITQDGIKVERKIQQSKRMTKETVPRSIWTQYATINRFDAIYIKKLKKD